MKYVGEIFSSKNYGDFIIVKYVGAKEVDIKFLKTGYETKSEMDKIRKGNVKDRLTPTVFGVGIVGDEPTRENGLMVREYTIWQSMLLRCYDEKSRFKYETYKDCIVSENFKSYQFFKNWCRDQVGFENKGWNLDKDILFKGNKFYSEDTCCFVPQEINKLFLKAKRARGIYPIGVSFNKKAGLFSSRIYSNGVAKHIGYFKTPEEAFKEYKKAKEDYVKEVAEKWKGEISTRVYEALTDYEVDVCD